MALISKFKKFTFLLIVTALIVTYSIAIGITTVGEGVFSGVIISPDPIKLGSTASIQYTISDTSFVSINVYNESGAPVRTIIKDVSKIAGSYLQSWDGKDDSGTLVPDGNYKIFLEAKSATGEIVGQVEKSQTAARFPTLSNVSDTPDPFNPVNNEQAAINYTLSNDAQVTVTILKGSTPVKVLVNNEKQSAGIHSINWDGKDENGNLSGDGVYSYQIDAVSSIAPTFKSTIKASTTVEKESPQISGITPNPDPMKISMNNLSIGYTLSENGKVNLKILDSQGTLVRSLLSSATKNAGYNSSVWDGKDGLGKYVAEGTYTISIDAVDNFGKSSGIQTKSFTAGYITSITNVSDSADPFDPTSGTQSTINYTINNTALVSISILKGSTAVKTLLANEQKTAGTYSINWDGKDDSGNLLGDGIYTYQIDVVSPTVATFKNTFKSTTTIETGSPKVTNITLNPDPMKIALNYLSIQYLLSENANVTAKILDKSNNVVKTLLNNVSKNAGNNSLSWNGLDDNNSYIPEGIYTVSIIAVDNTNNNSGAQTMTFTAGYQPEITNVTQQSSSFDPLKNEQALFTYAISKDALVTISILNGYTPVRTLVANELKIAGNYSFTWDGKDDLGNFLNDGTYSYRIDVVSPTVPSFKSFYKGSISLDSYDPTLTDLSINPIPVKVGINATIKYTLSEPATLSVQILDELGFVIRDFAPITKGAPGTYTLTWDTLNNLNTYVSSGAYTLRITAHDNATKTGSSEIGFQIAKTPVISNFTATPETIDIAAGQKTNISYNISEKSKVTLRIYDANNNLWNTLYSDKEVLENDSISWDGKGSNGLVVEGIYTYKIDATSVIGNLAGLRATGTIAVTNVPITLSKSCTDCHNTYPVSHPVTNCVGCHGDNTPIEDCLSCHPGWEHSDGTPLQNFQCTYCHNETYSYKIPYHPADVNGIHDQKNTTTCSSCHKVNLIDEHTQRINKATGQQYDCNTCHNNTRTEVITAIANHDTNCSACHINAGNHEEIHISSISGGCLSTSCHSNYLTTEHTKRGLSCKTCHDSTDKNVTNSISWHQTSCSSCHPNSVTHGLSFTQTQPNTIPKYTKTLTDIPLEWMAPQKISFWIGESWVPGDMTDGYLTISNRINDITANEVYNFYNTEMTNLDWNKVSGTDSPNNKFELVFTKDNKKVVVRFYNTEHFNSTTVVSSGYRVEIIYK